MQNEGEKMEPKGKRGAEKPVSLYPLTFEEALSGLLETPPKPKEDHGPGRARTPRTQRQKTDEGRT